MKNTFYTLLLTFSVGSLLAQDYSITYNSAEQLDGDYITLRDVSETSDGNLIIGYDNKKYYVPPVSGIMKTDADGAVIWSKNLEIDGSEASCSFEVVENSEGNYYLWGLSKQNTTGDKLAILSEINSDGDMLWSKKYDFGSSISTNYSINKLTVLPSGELQMMISVFEKVLVMRTDRNGEIIWGKISAMGPPDDGGGKSPGFEWLTIPDDGGMCASKANNDFALLRYSETGELLWNKSYKLGTYTHGKTIVKSPNGNILIAGFINYMPHIMEISDEDGSINWVKTFTYESSLLMTLNSAAHLNVVGEDIILDFTTTSALKNQFILKLDVEGNVLKSMVALKRVTDYNKLELLDKGEAYFYGGYYGDGVSERNAVLTRVSDIFTNSCVHIETETPITSVDYTDYFEVVFEPFEADFTNEESLEIGLVDFPLRAKLYCDVYLSENELALEDKITVYPNPSTDNVTIALADEFLNTTYTITDLSGKQVIIDQVQSTQFNVDLSKLTNGQYILTISGESEIITKKITVLK